MCLVETMKQANQYCELNINLLKIPNGGTLISWLFIKSRGFAHIEERDKFKSISFVLLCSGWSSEIDQDRPRMFGNT